jgi:hypothetical protein
MNIRPPNRVSRSYTQTIHAPPSEVFPLLCPVRETEWVNGWNPLMVLSHSGVAEPDCIFTTPSVPEDALWMITAYDPVGLSLEIIKLIPRVVVAKIEIRLSEAGEGTSAEVSYTYTSLGDYGDAVLEDFSENDFTAFMRTWEEELNHYLRTGSKIQRPVND